MNSPTIKETAAVIFAVFLGLAIGYKIHTPASTEVPVEVPIEVPIVKTIERIPDNTVVHLDTTDITADLETYSHLSAKHRDRILSAITTASSRYNINPLILYSIIYTESTFRWWLIHDIPKTKDKDQAIGLGGIRHSIWGDQLKSAGIIDVKSDLFDIEPNILAIAFIYDHYRSQPLLSGTTSADMSAMLRYFGGNHKEYFIRIDDKISSMIKTKIYK